MPRQDHADTAEALLREVERPRISLTDRIDELRAEAAEKQHAEQRLAALDRAQDSGLGALPRLVLLVVMGSMAGAMTTLHVLAGRDEYSPIHLLALWVATNLTAVGGVALFRHRLLANAYSKKVIGVLVGAPSIVLVQRIVAVFADTRGSDSIVVTLWVLIGIMGAGAFGVQPKLARSLPLLIVAALLSRLYPNHAMLVSSVAMMLSFGVTAYALRPRANKAFSDYTPTE